MYSKAIALTLTLAFTISTTSGSARTSVPSNLEVPAGHSVYLVTQAEGTQNYVCLPTSEGFRWVFYGPQATLFDGLGQQVATHFLSPDPVDGTARATWQHSLDTSRVWAGAIANSSDPGFVMPGAIPWLLLRAVATEPGPSGNALAVTTYIQRVNTVGGIAPATGCKSAKDTGKKALVPYTTDYIFYQAN